MQSNYCIDNMHITQLSPNEVFVFGSNLQGMHGGGAARLALRQFLYHIGFDNTVDSTSLSRANERREYRIYEEFGYQKDETQKTTSRLS